MRKTKSQKVTIKSKIFKICYSLGPKNGCAFFITDVFVTVLCQFDNGEYDKVGYINFESSKIEGFCTCIKVETALFIPEARGINNDK